MDIGGVKVRADVDGLPDWLCAGHELLGKRVYREDSQAGTITKFVYDSRVSGAQAALFCLEYDDGSNIEHINEKLTRQRVKRMADMEKSERISKRARVGK